MSNLKILFLVSVLLFMGSAISAESNIRGKINLDTTKWALVAYLSLIPDFGQMNTISYDFIVESATIRDDGSFHFQTHLLPEEDQLYRIHFSKKDDPPSSLIIGGKEHNHTFLFAKRNADVEIIIKSGRRFINETQFYGYSPNIALMEVNSLVNLIDSLDYYGGAFNREFLRNATYDQLREFADTCSFSLVSLYAVYQSNFETDYKVNPGYYKKFLRKWRSEKSTYFQVFRSDIDENSGSNWSVGIIIGSIIVSFVLVLFFVSFRKRNKHKSPLSSLTIQERKIFNSIKEGKTNKEIADEFAVSLSTIKSHVNNIYSKLGIKSRKEIMDIE